MIEKRRGWRRLIMFGASRFFSRCWCWCWPSSSSFDAESQALNPNALALTLVNHGRGRNRAIASSINQNDIPPCSTSRSRSRSGASTMRGPSRWELHQLVSHVVRRPFLCEVACWIGSCRVGWEAQAERNCDTRSSIHEIGLLRKRSGADRR